MTAAFICDAIRTPIGRYAGALASVRADDLAAIPIKALVDRSPTVDWNALDDVIYGCANQAGEDNRNVARMALLLAGLPKEISEGEAVMIFKDPYLPENSELEKSSKVFIWKTSHDLR